MNHVQPYCSVQVAFPIAIIIAGALCLGGCATGPNIQVTDQRLAERSEEADRIEFMLEMSNPSDMAIEMREIEYRLQRGGQTVYLGRRSAQATLPAGGSVQMLIPAVVSQSEQPDSGEANHYQLSGNISYITPGAIPALLRDIGFPRPRIGFAHQVPATW